jgi:hypothetical protein
VNPCVGIKQVTSQVFWTPSSPPSYEQQAAKQSLSNFKNYQEVLYSSYYETLCITYRI